MLFVYKKVFIFEKNYFHIQAKVIYECLAFYKYFKILKKTYHSDIFLTG